jgi:hypothetical protein
VHGATVPVIERSRGRGRVVLARGQQDEHAW